MEYRDRLIEGCTVVGGLLVLAGAMLKITDIEWASPLFLAGSLFFTVAVLSGRYRGTDRVMRRLSHQQTFGAVLLLLTAFLMFADPLHARLLAGECQIGERMRALLLALTRRNGWIVSMTLAAIIMTFSVFRMDKRQNDNDSGQTE